MMQKTAIVLLFLACVVVAAFADEYQGISSIEDQTYKGEQLREEGEDENIGYNEMAADLRSKIDGEPLEVDTRGRCRRLTKTCNFTWKKCCKGMLCLSTGWFIRRCFKV
jgi:hypothetical protein